jgi:hypothetical protein
MKKTIGLTESDLKRIVKRILNETKLHNVYDNILNKMGIKVNYQYFSHNNYNLTGTVRLYKDGEVLGRRDGYDFYYKFDQRFGTLTYDGHFPKIENIDIFKYLPQDETIKYFSDNLINQIKKDVSYLFNKKL